MPLEEKIHVLMPDSGAVYFFRKFECSLPETAEAVHRQLAGFNRPERMASALLATPVRTASSLPNSVRLCVGFFNPVVYGGEALDSDSLPTEYKVALRTAGFFPDTLYSHGILPVWSCKVPLSWARSKKLRALQECLQTGVAVSSPGTLCDPDAGLSSPCVAEHNAALLVRTVKAAYGLTLDFSLPSIAVVDHLLGVLDDAAARWTFQYFSAPLLIAAGDYVGEVMRRAAPASVAWRPTDPDTPLHLSASGTKCNPRIRVTKACLYGPQHALASYAQPILSLENLVVCIRKPHFKAAELQALSPALLSPSVTPPILCS